jgi:hypothetical protein
MYIYNFLLRKADAVSMHNTDRSPWGTGIWNTFQQTKGKDNGFKANSKGKNFPALGQENAHNGPITAVV